MQGVRIAPSHRRPRRPALSPGTLSAPSVLRKSPPAASVAPPCASPGRPPFPPHLTGRACHNTPAPLNRRFHRACHNTPAPLNRCFRRASLRFTPLFNNIKYLPDTPLRLSGQAALQRSRPITRHHCPLSCNHPVQDFAPLRRRLL